MHRVPSSRARRRGPAPRLVERLEARALLATFLVSNADDSGAGSLRQALLDANARSGADVVQFDITEGTGVRTIRPLSALPTITDPVVIDGYTQPGASPNTRPLALGPGAVGSDAVLRIELDGSLAGDVDGLTVAAGGSTIRGLAIHRFGKNNFGSAIVLATNGGNVVEGNFLGTDAGGVLDRGNHAAGVFVQAGSGDNTIGGTTPASRNVIAGNLGPGQVELGGGTDNAVRGNFLGTTADGTAPVVVPPSNNIRGVAVFSATGTLIDGNLISGVGAGLEVQGGSGARVQGNFFGTDLTGTAALGNSAGILLFNTSGNTIGGTTPARRNLVAASRSFGMEIAAAGNFLRGNYVGTDVSGARALGNQGDGIALVGDNNVIGGPTAAERNVISGNAGSGIFIGSTGGPVVGAVVEGNFLGTAADGVSPLGNQGAGITVGAANGASNDHHRIGGAAAGQGNTIAFNADAGIRIVNGVGNPIISNSIHDNGGLGIDLGARPGGVTPNDAEDPDGGPNGLQNFPILSSATVSAAQTTVTGTLNSLPETAFTLQFFAGAAGDPSGSGEGQTFLGQATVTTDAQGDAAFSVDVAAAPAGQAVITATATDPQRNTSEFSPALPAVVATATPGTLQFERTSYRAGEGDGQATITVTRTGGTDGEARVTVEAAQGGTAASGADYSGLPTTLSFADGQARQSFSIPISDDPLNEGDETVALALADPTGGASLGADATATLTIADDDPLPSLSIENAAVSEGDSGATDAAFTVRLSAPSGRVVAVDYATADNTATAPGDYEPAKGRMVFEPGQTSRTIAVRVLGDATPEPDETFFMDLATPANASLARGRGVGTILNDDGPVTTPPPTGAVPPPDAPGLDPGSDTGTSATDHLTADATPTFVGSARPGALVRLFSDGSPIGEARADETGRYALTPGAPIADGIHTITAVQVVGDVTSGPSVPMLPLLLIDTDPSVHDTTHQLYVRTVGRALLGQDLDPATLKALAGELDAGASPDRVVRQIQAMPAYRDRQIDEAYLEALGQLPTADQRAAAVKVLARGASPDRLRADLLGSTASYTLRGGTARGFVASLAGQLGVGRTGPGLVDLARRGEFVRVALALLDRPAAARKEARRAFARFPNSRVGPPISANASSLLAQLGPDGLDRAIADRFADQAPAYAAYIGARRYVTRLIRDALFGVSPAPQVVDQAIQAAGTDSRMAAFRVLAGVAYFTYDGGGNVVGTEDHTTALFQDAVMRRLFIQYLHRDPGPGTVFPPTPIGVSVNQTSDIILVSQEYFTTRTDGSAFGFVNSIYEDLLGRPATALDFQTVAPPNFDPNFAQEREALLLHLLPPTTLPPPPYAGHLGSPVDFVLLRARRILGQYGYATRDIDVLSQIIYRDRLEFAMQEDAVTRDSYYLATP